MTLVVQACERYMSLLDEVSLQALDRNVDNFLAVGVIAILHPVHTCMARLLIAGQPGNPLLCSRAHWCLYFTCPTWLYH